MAVWNNLSKAVRRRRAFTVPPISIAKMLCSGDISILYQPHYGLTFLLKASISQINLKPLARRATAVWGCKFSFALADEPSTIEELRVTRGALISDRLICAIGDVPSGPRRALPE